MSNDFYTLEIDLPPELLDDVTASYTIPAGLTYDPDSSAASGAAKTSTVTIDRPDSGSQQPTTITWKFGQVNNSEDQDITIRFKGIVSNISSNQDGIIIPPGRAGLSWTDFEGARFTSSTESKQVEVIEPRLDIEMSLAPSTVERGDKVECNIYIGHSINSHADAFDVDITEILPSGLNYCKGSMEIVNGPDGTRDDSNYQKLNWYFPEISRYWNGDQKIQLRCMAIIDKQVLSNDSLNAQANLAWTSAPGKNEDERSYSRVSKAALKLKFKQPNLKITLSDNPDPVKAGGKLNYTINFLNKGSYALGTSIKANYDPNLVFISASPEPDLGTNNSWTLGDLAKNDSGLIRITVQSISTLADSYVIFSSAKISCEEGITAQASASTKVMSTAPSLRIEKEASEPLIRPGGSLNYTINYCNTGDSMITNVTITDIVDNNLFFDPDNSNPHPSKIWRGEEGTHLWWNASILKTENLQPGDSGKVEIRVSLPPLPEHPQFDWVYNNYKIDSDFSEGDFKTLETAVIHSLYVRKKAENQAYSANEIVNYTIIYGNDLVVEADNAVVTDVLPYAEYLEFIEAEPSPTIIKDDFLVWNIGKIPPKGSGTILLYAKVKESQSEIKFKSRESVSGQGYVHFDQRLDTAQTPDRLTNYANITASYLGVSESDSSSATIALSDALGMALKIIGHGSGIYSRDDETQLLSKNKTIQVKTSLKERYSPYSFTLPQGRSIDYSSKWSEAQNAKNRVTGASLNERYMYTTRIDRNNFIILDKNGSTLESETAFEGAGHVGMLKQSSTNDASIHKGIPTYESQEDYLGSFRVYTKFDEYGKNVATNRSVLGVGSVSSDKRIGKSQSSFESGTGVYQVEDRIQTVTSYMAKDINVSQVPVSYAYTPNVEIRLSKKWREGMWSKSGTFRPKSSEGSNSKSKSSQPSSFLGEEFSQADFLKKSTIAKGLNEMKTDAEFSGTAEFKVIKSGLAANQSNNEVSLYDEYIGKYKLARNTEIGGVARFDEPHMSISKVGKTKPEGGTFIDYTITIVNNGNRALGPVYVLDLFPPGTEYVYSSLRPSELNGSYARWTLVDLGIGASSAIELRLNMTKEMDKLVNQVQAKGSYDNQWVNAENFSTIELNWLSCCPPQMHLNKISYVDAKDPMLIHYRIDSVSADALCREEIREGVYQVSNSNWRPPKCFGLNYTQQGFGEEWIPCYSCSTPEEFSPLGTICSSC